VGWANNYAAWAVQPLPCQAHSEEAVSWTLNLGGAISLLRPDDTTIYYTLQYNYGASDERRLL
jgi:hypothetical protein